MLERPTTLRAALAAIAVVAAAAGVGAAVHAGWLGSRKAAVADGAAPCAAGTSAACAMGRGGFGAAEGEALKGQPRLVEFVSGHCPACSRMAPVVADLERRCMAKAEGSLVQVNVDEPEGEALASRYKVQRVPTFVGVDAQGLEVMRMIGEQSPQKLALALGEVRGKACPSAL
jgi:cytochrome c-type biogenesis protein